MSESKPITMGADPELLITDTHGVPAPAWLITGGLKHGAKEPVPGLKGLEVHADGVALEYNFAPVPPTLFRQTATNALKYLRGFVSNKAKGQYVIAAQPEAEGYTKEVLAHPLAMMTGCDPDFDAYGNNPEIQRNINLAPAATSQKKFFGGHIHVGYDKDVCPPWAAARLMDLFVYLPIMHSDTQKERRGWHGKPGIFRPKPYGMEYRTPSNFWVQSPDAMVLLEHNTQRLFETIHFETDKLFEYFHKVNWDNVRKIVDARDKKEARKLWDSSVMDFGRKVGARFAYLES